MCSVPGQTQGRRRWLALIAFLSLLTSDLVGWEPTMHSDGLVSKESLRADAVDVMVLGAVVGAVVGACYGGCWGSHGWCSWMSAEVQSGAQWRRVGVLVGALVGPVASVAL